MGTDKNAGTGKRSDMKIGDELEPLTVYYYDISAAIDRLVRHVLKIIPVTTPKSSRRSRYLNATLVGVRMLKRREISSATRAY